MELYLEEPLVVSHYLIMSTKIIEIAVKNVKENSIISGTGSNSTDEAIELSKFTEKAGSDALLIVTPYYNKPLKNSINTIKKLTITWGCNYHL